ncbi:hypothetical protein [Leptolyngbya ohadii]|uniref:hypothetical protein n=1 Tax=Leptolyngbya ohadii TaxID=1962290 RepID=UPI000B5A1719|nr:hypothetical protein [Leptolyngbya ohadii]
MTPIETPVAADAAVTLSSATVASTAETATLEATPEAAPVQSSAYRDRLNPWCVVRLSEQAPVPVARFRRRPDAEAHLRLLGPANRDKFAIVFHNPAETAAE